ncbi:hypothetical protein [Flagellimonas pelagia]|uniref:DUF6242 domain-containing protein n=1 Tax=Flagellimonas pelagia TaxID=2306998 RepID=A0A3A1NHG0_9FLAO|nr:hypothetical protein [Allomuricauda maritima]RIV42886.1 hypothetical protein D2V05_14815 [Allomuricauda maritima]TXJ92080.1 hypothetical protein FQ017_14680 [Allomuricauda maritima]
MKSNFFVFLLLVIFITTITSCSSDGGVEEPPTSGTPTTPEENGQPENQAPASFSLVAIEDEAEDVELKPSFEWTESVDPESETVTYTLFLGQEEDPITQIATNLNTLTYNLDFDLEFATTYFWKVVAEDGSGNTTNSSTYSFKIRPVGTFISDSSFGARHLAAVVEFNGKLFIIGGYGYNPDGALHYLDDVWSSTDGENWILETDAPGFMPRAFHQVVVFDNKMLLIGGFRWNGAPSSDIWSSVDGKNWVLEKENAEFPADWGHKILSYNNKLWLITGGQNEFLNQNVWNSNDGVNWSLVTEDIGFMVSLEQEAVVFNDKMWVVVQDKVFSSIDGIDWALELENAPFQQTYKEYSLVVYDEKMILMVEGASTDSPAVIWSSANGKDWEQEYQETGFPNRHDNSMVVFLDKIYVMLGYNGDIGYLNDIWILN